MTAEALVRELRVRGIELTVVSDHELRIAGNVTDADIDAVRQAKQEVIEYLRRRSSAAAPSQSARLKALGPYLCSPVTAGEWGAGTLWGLSPRGAIVDVGKVLVTFELDEVEPLERCT